jgi:hypothetical protein
VREASSLLSQTSCMLRIVNRQQTRNGTARGIEVEKSGVSPGKIKGN